jgi:hypothetical protein
VSSATQEKKGDSGLVVRQMLAAVMDAPSKLLALAWHYSVSVTKGSTRWAGLANSDLVPIEPEGASHLAASASQEVD